MTPAERFVVIAGISLLILNVVLFSLCISLVRDSQSTKDDNAQLLALFSRLHEEKEAANFSTPTSEAKTLPLNASVNTTTPKPAAIRCPFVEGVTTQETEQPSTEGPTESMAEATTEFLNENTEGTEDEEEKRSRLEDKLRELEDEVEELRRKIEQIRDNQ